MDIRRVRAGQGLGRGGARPDGKTRHQALGGASRWGLGADRLGACFGDRPTLPGNDYGRPDSALAQCQPRRAAPQRIHPFRVGIAKVTGNWDYRNERVSEAQAAERATAAISSDWWTVGDDLRFAMERVQLVERADAGR